MVHTTCCCLPILAADGSCVQCDTFSQSWCKPTSTWSAQGAVTELQRSSLTTVLDVIAGLEAAEQLLYASLEVRDILEWYVRTNETYVTF